MKRIISLAVIAAAALLLTACQREPSFSERYEEWKSKREEEYAEELAAIPDKIPLPDGTTALKSELSAPEWEEESSPKFDFAFIRYAEPIFVSTFDDPDIVGFDTFEINGDIPREIEPQWIKVKAGDVLENGLKVVSAQTPVRGYKDDDGNTVVQLSFGKVKPEGEMTFEGILQYFNGSEYYGSGDYYINFYPDSTKYRIPVIYNDDPSECAEIQVRSLDTTRNRALVYDGGNFYYFRFESQYYQAENDFKDMFTEDTVCRATMSFKDIVVFGRGNLDGEITDIELEK